MVLGSGLRKSAGVLFAWTRLAAVLAWALLFGCVSSEVERLAMEYAALLDDVHHGVTPAAKATPTLLRIRAKIEEARGPERSTVEAMVSSPDLAQRKIGLVA